MCIRDRAWCLWDMLTHPRYGMGKRLGAADVYKWALYVIGQNCDPVSYTHLDVYKRQSELSALQRIEHLALLKRRAEQAESCGNLQVSVEEMCIRDRHYGV